MTKPATQRPKLPSVGRLGLVDPPAGERLAQLGWDREEDQAHIDLLWALSRAPDPDAGEDVADWDGAMPLWQSYQGLKRWADLSAAA